MNKTIIFLSAIACLIMHVSCSQTQPEKERQVGRGCEDCELMLEGMPKTLSWKTTLVSATEQGEPLLISGVIYKKDGKTPAPDVILYVYHTDNKGLYSQSQGQVHGKRHGHIRGWVKTDAQGRYEFKTIRPASYPNSQNPQHIHPIIKEPGVSFYWIDEFLFTDDPLLPKEENANRKPHGGSGVITLTKNEKGEWVGTRDIILGKNVEGY